MLSISRCAKWAFVLGLPLSVLGGCSRQGPGERCDTLNGSNDCDDGLVCVPKDTLHGTASLCCPAAQTGPESIVPGCTYGAATVVVQDSGAAQTGDATSDAAEGGSASDAAGAGADGGGADGGGADGGGADGGGADGGGADGGGADGGGADGGGADVATDGASSATDANLADGSADAAG
jgi:hypothetical protein